MKKTSTYYFAVLALANAGLGSFFIRFNRIMLDQFTRNLEGKNLPPITSLATRWPWWPFAFAAFFALGLVASIATRYRSESLCHFIIFGLVAEVFILFWTTVAYAVPFVSVIPRLSM